MEASGVARKQPAAYGVTPEGPCGTPCAQSSCLCICPRRCGGAQMAASMKFSRRPHSPLMLW